MPPVPLSSSVAAGIENPPLSGTGSAASKSSGGETIMLPTRASAPVVAVRDGVVVASGVSRRYGGYVTVRDADGDLFTYSHLARVGSRARGSGAERRGVERRRGAVGQRRLRDRARVGDRGARRDGGRGARRLRLDGRGRGRGRRQRRGAPDRDERAGDGERRLDRDGGRDARRLRLDGRGRGRRGRQRGRAPRAAAGRGDHGCGDPAGGPGGDPAAGRGGADRRPRSGRRRGPARDRLCAAVRDAAGLGTAPRGGRAGRDPPGGSRFGRPAAGPGRERGSRHR